MKLDKSQLTQIIQDLAKNQKSQQNSTPLNLQDYLMARKDPPNTVPASTADQS